MFYITILQVFYSSIIIICGHLLSKYYRCLSYTCNIQVVSLPLILNRTAGDFWYGIIGKKHVGPDYVYPFPFSYTEEHYNLDQVGRNITRMKEIVTEFFTLAQSKGKPFFSLHRHPRSAQRREPG